MPCRSLQIEPFQLPLSADQFAAALQSGHGRALMHARAHGVAGMESQVIDACLHNRAYDPQLEFDRGAWMFEIVVAGGIEGEMATALLPCLKFTKEKDHHDHLQQVRLAMLLSRRGHSDLRTAVERLLCEEEKFHDNYACDMIIEFDGADGLLGLAERAGKSLSTEETLYVGPWMMEEYDERHGTGAAERILAAAAAHNEFVAVYMQEVYEDREEKQAKSADETPAKPRKLWSQTAEELIGHVRDLQERPQFPLSRFRLWGMKASAADREHVFEELHTETDAMRISLYLLAFDGCGMPRWSEKVLEWGASADDYIRWGALRVLANHQHPAVRDLAWKRIHEGQSIDGELRLLIKNYQPGDWNDICSHLQLPDGIDERHSILQDLQNLYEEVEEPLAAMPHLLVYEHTPCGNCRRCAVESLIKLDSAPEWLLGECRFDSEMHIRKLVSKGGG